MRTCYVLLLFSIHFVFAQEEPLSGFNSRTTDQNVTLSGFSYPTFLNGERHANFLASYGVSDNLQMQLEGFYDTYLTSNRLRVSFAMKRYLTKKLYVFGGIEMESADYKGLFPPQSPRIGAVMGFGYDVLNNFVIEGKFNAQLNNSPMGAYGEPFVRMPRVYTIGGKVKF